MVKDGGLEERFCSFLDSRRVRESPPRYAPWLTAAVAIAGVISVNVFQLREASAVHTHTAPANSIIRPNETHWVIPNGDDAVLPEGVTVHAIVASEVSTTIFGNARPSDQIWWHPDGTLYSSPPRIGDLHDVTDVMSNRARGRRRLRFAVRIDNLPKGQHTGFGLIPDGRFADDTIVTTATIPGGLVWFMYYSVPKDAREESMSVMVSHGPWKETLRRPLVWSPVSKRPLWDELRFQTPSPSSVAAPQAYATLRVFPVSPTQPGTFDFAVRLARRDVTDSHGNDWRFFLLDKDGHRLTSRNSVKTWRKNDIFTQFSTDEKTARRAAFVGVESRPFTYVTFKHLAVKPKSR